MPDERMAIEHVGPSAPGKLKVFVSYSRNDIDFADQLVAALELCRGILGG